MGTLKRTQMYFPEDMLNDLKRAAKNEGATVSEIVREVVSEYIAKRKERDWNKDPLWNMIGSGKSKEGDLSIHHDKYLYGKKK